MFYIDTLDLTGSASVKKTAIDTFMMIYMHHVDDFALSMSKIYKNLLTKRAPWVICLKL